MDSYRKDPPEDEHIRSLLVSQGMDQNDVIRYKCVAKHMMQLTSNPQIPITYNVTALY